MAKKRTEPTEFELRVLEAYDRFGVRKLPYGLQRRACEKLESLGLMQSEHELAEYNARTGERLFSRAYWLTDAGKALVAAKADPASSHH